LIIFKQKIIGAKAKCLLYKIVYLMKNSNDMAYNVIEHWVTDIFNV